MLDFGVVDPGFGLDTSFENPADSGSSSGFWFASGLWRWYKDSMTVEELRATLGEAEPPGWMHAPLAALWWDAKGEWARAHGLVDELETAEGMAVHAYLHRKEGEASNAEYWYRRAGKQFHRAALEQEWAALVEGIGGIAHH